MRMRGQAAMEFLMTYGWAILIMLVVIAVLFYLGVFSPGTTVPKRCTLPPGFTCYDYSINLTGYLNLDLGQAIGRDINVTALGCNATQNPPTLYSLTTVVNIPTGGHMPVVGVGAPANNNNQCCNVTGEPCRAKLAIRYNYVGSQVNRVVYGDISGSLESVSP